MSHRLNRPTFASLVAAGLLALATWSQVSAAPMIEVIRTGTYEPEVASGEFVPSGEMVIPTPDGLSDGVRVEGYPLDAPQQSPFMSWMQPRNNPSQFCDGDCAQQPCESGCWSWQLLPDGLIYRSYLAGVKEPRISGVWGSEHGWFQDVTLGGRVGILRYGNTDNMRPQGWQLDMEGAAFPRINLKQKWDLDSADFRFGVPLTYGIGRYQMKIEIYHLSSHVGDEYLVRNPGYQRINFSRDVIVWGHSYYPIDSVRVYGEVGWAYETDGGSKPWEFQFGLDYSPAWDSGTRGAPFAAINAHLRQEVNYGGEFVVQAGWQWRGTHTRHLLRTGLQYFNGQDSQYQFFRNSQQYAGIGLWYDY